MERKRDLRLYNALIYESERKFRSEVWIPAFSRNGRYCISRNRLLAPNGP